MADDRVEPPGTGERFLYAAMPVADRQGSRRQFIDIRNNRLNGRLSCEVMIRSQEGSERILLEAANDGDFLSATRTTMDAAGNARPEEKVWRTGKIIHAARGPGPGARERRFTIPSGLPVAVDASLLLLLRSFPFDTGEQWDVYMVDFSQLAVTVTARLAGIESVRVPAGSFECYRFEVTVNLPVIKPRITYWLSKDPPHFLVRHEGKRGPFTLNYETSLLSYELKSP